MVGWRRIITVAVGGLALCATVQADMMPVSRPDAGFGKLLQVCVSTDSPGQDFTRPFDSPAIADLDSLSIKLLPKARADAGPTGETQPLQIFAKEPRSVDLCLYALLGLGLCRSAPFVKKLHVGCIPDWYHCGGPSQIGHSLAISPDCLCPAPVCCFVQPDCTVEDHIPQYRQEIVVSLWRTSQFTPLVLASRGPPYMS